MVLLLTELGKTEGGPGLGPMKLEIIIRMLILAPQSSAGVLILHTALGNSRGVSEES